MLSLFTFSDTAIENSRVHQPSGLFDDFLLHVPTPKPPPPPTRFPTKAPMGARPARCVSSFLSLLFLLKLRDHLQSIILMRVYFFLRKGSAHFIYTAANGYEMPQIWGFLTPLCQSSVDLRSAIGRNETSRHCIEPWYLQTCMRLRGAVLRQKDYLNSKSC